MGRFRAWGGGVQLVKRPWKIINCCNLCSLRNTGTDLLRGAIGPTWVLSLLEGGSYGPL